MNYLLSSALAAALALAHPGATTLASAQTSFRVRPSFNVMQLYETNVLSTPSNPESDFITRVTAGLESHYLAPRWTISGRYVADAEQYERHHELTSLAARQQVAVAMTHRPTPRLAVAGGADLLSTRDPLELNRASGLAIARARATRFSARTSLAHELNPLTSSTVEYILGEDRLDTGYQGSTHAATARLERRLSPRTTVSGGYRFHGFAFATASLDAVVISHSVAAGVRRTITPRVSLSFEAGPRTTGSVLRPELSASCEWTDAASNAAFSYIRTQATVIGLVGSADIQSLHASYSRHLKRALEVRVAPGIVRSVQAGRRADVYLLSAAVVRHLGRIFALELTADAAVQRGSLYDAPAGQTIRRHRVHLRLRATPQAEPPHRNH